MKKEEKRPAYIICPRCELNYITKKDKLCPVCKAEMGLLDKSILIPDEEEIEKICPICKVNVLAEDEEICFVCQKETVKDPDNQKSWLASEETENSEIEEVSLEFVAEEEISEPFDDELVPGLDYDEDDEDEAEEFEKEYEDDDDFDDDYEDEDFDDEDEDEGDSDEDDL